MIPFLVAFSLLFPSPASPEIPVSTPVLGNAPNQQSGLRVASSGSVTLAAWSDSRTRGGGVMASRVDVTGKPLDPTGIVIRDRADLDDVLWDGTDFVVITSRVAEDHELAFVGVDGVIRKRISLPIAQNYAAHTYEGANSRLLFLPHDGYSPLATIADLDGNIVKRGGDDLGGPTAFPASNGTRFLVIRQGTTFAAEALDRDGNVLSSVDPQLPSGFLPSSLSGDGRGGYVVVGHAANQDAVLIHLDASGVAQGAPVVLAPYDNLLHTSAGVRATMTSGGFVVASIVSLMKTVSYIAEVRPEGGPAVFSYTSSGFVSDVAYDPDACLVFTSARDFIGATGYDVWVQKGTDSRQPLTQSARDQSGVQIAAGASGFLAAWNELTEVGKVVYVRRFAVNGEPLGDPMVFSDTVLGSAPRVTSSGDVYLITAGGWARRMDARTREWLDTKEFQLGDLAIGSNGKDALALTLGTCGFNTCVYARHVAMTGEPLLFPPVQSPMLQGAVPVVASNGKDYLVVWAQPECGFGCPVSHYRIEAIRVGADGSRIDPAPILLTESSGFISNPSVSWNGQTYLVAWQDHVGLAGTFISSAGDVQPLGSLGDGTFAAAAGGNFLLFRRLVSNITGEDEWDGRVLGESDWTPIVKRPNLNFGPPSVASNGAYVMLAYDRVSEEAGHVGRVFLDPRVFATRKRAVH